MTSDPSPYPQPVRRRPARALWTVGLLLGLLLAACAPPAPQDQDDPGAAGPTAGEGAEPAPDAPEPAPGEPAAGVNVEDGATDVPVSTALEVAADPGTTIDSVSFTRPEEDDLKESLASPEVEGRLNSEQTGWTAAEGLDPDTSYTGTIDLSTAGGRATTTVSFSTESLPVDQQVYPETAVADGETYGIGMPIQITFDLPVADRKTVEKHLHVRSEPEQDGSWHWFSDTVVRYRPAEYWQAGTEIDLTANLNGVDFGDDLYGQHSVHESFTIGDDVVEKVDLKKKQLQYVEDGEVNRTLPISAGKEGFTTRSGIKVISEKEDAREMNSETVSIYGDEAYNVDVQWAMRITNSGEFLHSAPWNDANMGKQNNSHGCTGLSTDDAGWLYERSPIGTPVEYTGSDRETDIDNGYGDWNVDFDTYRKGSAL